jgi:hypothetical protein
MGVLSTLRTRGGGASRIPPSHAASGKRQAVASLRPPFGGHPLPPSVYIDGVNACAQVWTDDDRLIVREPGGLVGLLDDVVVALSRGGRYAAFCWNEDADMTFVYAVDGVVRRWFDPLIYEPDGALPEEAGLPFPNEDVNDTDDGPPLRATSAALTLIERLTGARLDDPALWHDHALPLYLRLPQAT